MAKELLDGKILLDKEILRPEEYKKEPYYIEYLGNGLILRKQFHSEKAVGCFFLLMIALFSLIAISEDHSPDKRIFFGILLTIFSLSFISAVSAPLFHKPLCFNKKADLFWHGKYVELDPFKKDEKYGNEQHKLSNLLYISIEKELRGVMQHDSYYEYADERGIITFYSLSLTFVNSDEIKVTQSPNSGYILFLTAEIASYLEAEVKLPAELKTNFEREIKMRSQNPDAIKISTTE